MESVKKPCPNRRPSWFDLPLKLKKGPTALKNLSGIGAVIKSWSADTSSPPTPPQLVEIVVNPTPTTPCRKIPPGDDGFSYYYRRMELYRESGGQGIFFKGYSHQQLVVLDANLSHCYARSAVSGGLHFLPAWDRTVPFKLATLSSDEDIMVITGVSIPAFGFFNKENKNEKKSPPWKMKNCSAIDLYNPVNDQNKPMVFTNAIGSEGKYYAISLQGTLAVIEDWEIKDLGKNRAVPAKEARVFREHLLEFKNQIYLVFLVSRGSIDVVDDVEVMRLDVENGYSWEKMEGLPADAMFFVGEKCCLGISARVVGSKGNCVYFTHHRAAGWFVYDMGGKCISPTRGPEVDRTEAHTSGFIATVMDYL